MHTMRRGPALAASAAAVAAFCVGAIGVAEAALNLHPVIGILSQPSPDLPNNGKSYIASSYVKFIESSGARVVPLIFGTPDDEIKELMSGLNGVLFPGGGASLMQGSEYRHFSDTIYNAGISMNDNGVHFPMWGTCLGFEYLNMAASGNDGVLTCGWDAEDLPIPFDFVAGARKDRMLSSMSDELYQALSTENITHNEHHCSVSLQAYQNSTALQNFFSILATDEDRHGETFLALVSGKKYPVFGSQPHPEKNVFEWHVEAAEIPHTLHAVQFSQYFANFFVEEARKNSQSLGDALVSKLIYNYTPVYTHEYFEQRYIF